MNIKLFELYKDQQNRYYIPYEVGQSVSVFVLDGTWCVYTGLSPYEGNWPEEEIVDYDVRHNHTCYKNGRPSARMV